MPKIKIFCISSPETADKLAYAKAPPSSNSNTEEDANEKFRKAVQLKIDQLEAQPIRNGVEENLLQAFKLIIEKISSEINMTQEDKKNKKIRVTQEIPLSFQEQLQAISLKNNNSKSQNKIETLDFDHEKKSRNPFIIRSTDLQQNRLKPIEKLDHKQSQNKDELSELEKKLARQREWEEKNINTGEAKPATPFEIDTPQESKSIVKIIGHKDKSQFIEYSEYEEKAINLLNSLKSYLESDEFENIEFRVTEDISNGFNEQKLQELMDYEKEIKNRFFYGKINEIFQTLVDYLDANELDKIKDKINTKYASNDLNEQDLNDVNDYATEKMNCPVKVVHRFKILSTITEEPENRRTLEMHGIDKRQQLIDELDSLLLGLHEFTKENNFSQPATYRSSFFSSSTGSKEFDAPRLDNFLSRP
jgi:hypothetical protein